jgi:acetyl-CoA carboxylase biotin carboxylase subunit
MSTKFNRVLIANRGEIAVRVIRALREMEIESVAIYSDADSSSLHVKMADYAINLPGTTSADTYLNIPILIDAIKSSGADGVHPGYGFLSENADFVKQIEAIDGVNFIGPSSTAMRVLGDKIAARDLMIKSNVPVVPGVEHALTSVDELKEIAERIGYPLILKAAAGGGGRGMRIVRADSELKDAFENCSREAVSYFGNGDVFCEKYIEHPRHIEFQTMFDGHGNGIHLFERDCSIQRRHQKLFEEAPSVYLNETQRKKMGDVAVKAGIAAGYKGAATVEFICDGPDNVYFMEMNTRIQVEHPVTEMITGVDLIKMMINVCSGEPLPIKQDEVKLNGYALEARINAEDPAQGFLPAPGIVKGLHLPAGPFVRVDTHLYQGYEIPATYDSMVAKLIVWGENRDEALARMRRALNGLEIDGVPTTAKFHEALCQHEDFIAGNFTTRFIEETEDYFKKKYEDQVSRYSDEEIAALMSVLAIREDSNSAVLPSEKDRSRWMQRGKEIAAGINSI